MNSTVFAVAVVSAMVGGVIGVILHYFVSKRTLDEIAGAYLEACLACDSKDEVIAKLQDEINHLHQALAVKSLKEVRDHMKKVTNEMCNVKFFDVNDLPKHFDDDIDFGGKF